LRFHTLFIFRLSSLILFSTQIIMKKQIFSLLALLAVAVVGVAALVAAPSWWASYGLSEPASSTAASAALNRGGLRNLAVRAAAALDDALDSGLGDELEAFVDDLAPAYSGGIWFASPQSDDDAGVSVAELRAVAALFYDRLIEEGLAADYPWEEDDGGDDPATVGDAAALFNFELFPASGSSGVSSGSGFSTAVAETVASGETVDVALANGGTLQIVNNSGVTQTLPSSFQLQQGAASASASSRLQSASGSSNPADAFSYDARGWLATGSLDVGDTVYFTRDAEGNILYVE
jgi:hypothetical protein